MSITMKALGFGLTLAITQSAAAGEVLVAVASNFTEVATELGQKFQARSGHTVKFSFGSSGKFVTQIENGAPFEVFLSADAARPEALEKTGLGVKGTRFVYAVGKLVLWSPVAGYVDGKGEVLRKNGFSKIAIANPKAAPYGQAAMEVTQKRGLWEAIAPKVVQGENISQTYQFVQTGNAQLGFIALSQVLGQKEGKRGSYWVVPEGLYAPIEQQAILLQKGADNTAAKTFLDFLKSEDAKAVIKHFGYGV